MPAFKDAFISYGRADSKAFASQLSKRLAAAGIAVWFDFDDIPLARDFQERINDGIEKSHNFLYVISPSSVNSPYCDKELQLALKYNKRIIPLMHVEEISLQTWRQRHPQGTELEWQAFQSIGKHRSFDNLNETVRKLNWVMFRTRDDVEQSFEGLLDLFGQERNYVQHHTQLLMQALNWERHHRQTRYLLVGAERQGAETWLKKRLTDEVLPYPSPLHCEFITESIKNANNLMTQVFLCHAEKDREIAEQVRRSLMRNGITAWIHHSDIKFASDFKAAMARGMEEADNVVFLMSPYALESQYCHEELDYALSLHKRIIPLLAGDVNLQQVPSFLQNLQYIDLTDNHSEDDYAEDESNLLRILKEDAIYYNEHKVLLTKALKWERQQRNPCILLRGYELQHALAWLKLAKQHPGYGPTFLQSEFITASEQQPPGISLDVFVSYSRADSDFARKLNDGLQRQGKRTWFDQESIASGADFQQEIYRGIEASDHFLFILSPKSVNSPYCADEVEYAAKLNKRIITVRHRAIAAPDLHPELAKVQWIDFQGNDADFAANFKELIRTLDAEPEHLRFHTRLLLQAIAWDKKGQRESLLLRGDELTEAEQWLLKASGKQPSPTELQGTYVAASRQVASGRQRTLVGALGSLLTLAIMGGGVAVWQSVQANQARAAAETEALNANMMAASLTAESLMTTGLNFKAWLSALALGQAIQDMEKAGAPASALRSGVRLQAVSALREIYNAPGYMPKNTLVGHTDKVSVIALSPDGRTLASASDDSTIKLWNMSGELLNTLKGHSDGAESIAFSPDSKTLASASNDSTIKLWNTNGELLAIFDGHSDEVESVAFAPDGKTLASANSDRTIKLWNMNGELLATFDGHSDEVESVAFSPDGRILASASEDYTIKVWRNNGELLNTLEGHSEEIHDIAFSPDGKILASASDDNTVRTWELASGRQLLQKSNSDNVTSVAFAPDGKTLAWASHDNTIKLWDLESHRLVQTLFDHSDGVRSIAFSPDGNILVSASDDETIKIWQADPDRELQALDEHKGIVRSVAFAPDGKTFASASFDGTVKLWDISGQLLYTLNNYSDVEGIAFAPDGETLASASGNAINLWDTNGRLLDTLEDKSENWSYYYMNSGSFSSDGSTIASGSREGTIKLWDTNGGTIQRLKGHDDVVSSVSFSPDGSILASASYDDTVKLWDVESGALRETLTEHSDDVRSVAFSPDGSILASGAEDNVVMLWDMDGNRFQILEGHAGEVRSVAFAPDGHTLASASDDHTIKLWDIASGRELQTLTGHSDTIASVAFSPDGGTLVSASSDYTVKLWNFDLDDLMLRSCSWLKDYMTNPATPDEVKAYCADELSGVSNASDRDNIKQLLDQTQG